MRRVYVGGKYGDTPVTVARTLEQAMSETLKMFVGDTADAFSREWTCGFIDGEPSQLLCELVVIDPHDGETISLYVERYDIERDIEEA